MFWLIAIVLGLLGVALYWCMVTPLRVKADRSGMGCHSQEHVWIAGICRRTDRAGVW